MGRARRRSRRRGAPPGERVERIGLAALTWTWTAAMSIARALVGGLARVAAAARDWLAAQRRAVQVLVLAAAALACALGARALLDRERAVYVDDEAEALARVIRSEAGTCPMVERVHVAWATRNLAAERGQTIAEMACSPCGPQERGRPVSSKQPATERDRELARHVLAAPQIMDPTGGATHFINPALQDELAARGAPGYRGRPYSHVRRVWSASYGWEPYYRLGPRLEMWGPRRAR
ncbi:MAG TPA: hypothetical protein VKZ63_18680 [Kofleriaceae bacterium]|nr:hypothetical protein [Kofleriaceae bacterium]